MLSENSEQVLRITFLKTYTDRVNFPSKYFSNRKEKESQIQNQAFDSVKQNLNYECRHCVLVMVCGVATQSMRLTNRSVVYR